MSNTETREQFIRKNYGKVFTFNDAIEFEKFLNRNFGTGYINWVHVKTKKCVQSKYIISTLDKDIVES